MSRAHRAHRLLAGAAMWLAVPALGTAHAQDDDAQERLEDVNTLRLLLIRGAGLGLYRPGADPGVDDVNGGVSVGFAAAALEKRGAAWEAVAVSGRGWPGETFDLRVVALDVRMLMFGTDVDGDLCVAAFTVVHFGDCVHGGAIGARLLAVDLQHEFGDARWFARWFEAGLVLSPVGDSFDVDFITHRLPFLLGVSLDHTWNTVLPDGNDHDLRLRGVAGVDWLLRFAGYGHELSASVRYRPSVAPFDPGDWGLEGRVRLGYLFVERLLGSVGLTIQRLFLDVGFAHWTTPALADRWSWTRNRSTFELILGFELTLRDATPT